MVQLSDDEAAMAREILQQAYQDLREEIYKTENTDYRAALKRREEDLSTLIAKLGGAASPQQ